MTLIHSAVRSSYHGCEKTFVIPKLRVKFIPRCTLIANGVTRSKVKRVGGREIYLCIQEILYSA